MPHFYLRVTPSDTAKIVISVSKKVSSRAVMRNTVRRRVRATVREFIPKLKLASYFIVAKSGAENIKGKALEDELAALFKNL